MRLITAAVLGAVALAGCSNKDDLLAFDGQYYKSKVSKVDGQYDVFTVAVRPVSASLTGAREAGRYEATVYCVNTFGNSDIIWASGPDDPDETLTIENDTLLLAGTCPQ